MPLVYDDVDGSWGEYSKDWPSIAVPKRMIANQKGYYRENAAAQILCRKAKIPYGSYVIDAEINSGSCKIRLENEILLKKLKSYLKEKAGG